MLESVWDNCKYAIFYLYVNRLCSTFDHTGGRRMSFLFVVNASLGIFHFLMYNLCLSNRRCTQTMSWWLRNAFWLGWLWCVPAYFSVILVSMYPTDSLHWAILFMACHGIIAQWMSNGSFRLCSRLHRSQSIWKDLRICNAAARYSKRYFVITTLIIADNIELYSRFYTDFLYV